MPLPKASKMSSKRFKKSKTLYPFIDPPPPPASSPSSDQPSSLHKLWPPAPLRKWRVRVICTDPDATDDSSCDELDTPPSSSPHKRSIHEILLPVRPSSLPPQPSMPESSSHPRRKRQSPDCSSLVRSRKLCCEIRDAEAVLQDMDARLHTPSSEACIGSALPGLLAHNRSVLLTADGERAPAEEEFTRFLSEFVMDIEEESLWEDRIDGLAMPQEDEIADMLNLELDPEALTWVNSLQRLP